MIIRPTPLSGAFVVEVERLSDERGFFARTFCVEEFAANGLGLTHAQCSISFNAREGTLRGMHFQAPPQQEDKLIRCTAGAIFDVIVDIRPASPSYGRWHCEELTTANRRALLVPKGFAHGFMTLATESEVLYMISVPFAPALSRVFRWNDPDVAVAWPHEPTVMSSRDAEAPLLRELQLH